ncbi:MAG: Rrf2 family transcriptional regulator [Tissierellia bacterium]|nr:Rrf2 family transcriptional regulator [Tissierellia bacterium]
MRVSTKGRYGLRTMHYLAKNNSEKAIPLSKIASELKISDVYLEQILRRLRQADLVESVRGAYGGYKINKDPENISVGDVLRVLETHMSPTECCESNTCEDESDCVARFIWKRIEVGINEIIDKITLQDMIELSVE